MRGLTLQRESTVRSVNFIFGLLLFAVALFFIFSREVLVGPTYQVDSFLIILSGILSLWASVSEKIKTIFFLNLSLGVLFFISALAVGISRIQNAEYVISLAYDYTRGDLVVHAFFSLIFFYNALLCRQSRFRMNEV